MNNNFGMAEYLKLCAKRMTVLLPTALAVFLVVLFSVRIITPVQYTVTATLRIQSDVEGESIADQYNISELSKAAALTSISLVDNSDTVQRAMRDTGLPRSADPVDYQRRLTVTQINESNVLRVVVRYPGERTEAETFTANLMRESNTSVQEAFANSNPAFFFFF